MLMKSAEIESLFKVFKFFKTFESTRITLNESQKTVDVLHVENHISIFKMLFNFDKNLKINIIFSYQVRSVFVKVKNVHVKVKSVFEMTFKKYCLS